MVLLDSRRLLEAAELAGSIDRLKELIGADAAEISQAEQGLQRFRGPADRPPWAERMGRDQYGTWAEFSLAAGNSSIGVRMRYIPAGIVKVGSPPDEFGREEDEQAVWLRQTRGLWLAEHETTQELWLIGLGFDPSRDLDESPARFQATRNPVEQVSFNQVQAWINELNTRFPSLRARLPTEVEWELAARAGYQGAYIGEDPAGLSIEELDRVAWFKSVCERPQAVGLRNPNPLGLYDCLGNVWEWCKDSYAPYPVLPGDDRIGRGSDRHVVRGGSFADFPEDCRLANRFGLGRDRATMMVGFRLAIDVVEELPIPSWPAVLESADATASAVSETQSRKSGRSGGKNGNNGKKGQNDDGEKRNGRPGGRKPNIKTRGVSQ